MVVRSFSDDGESVSRFCPLMTGRACFEFDYDGDWDLGMDGRGICRGV